MAFLAPILGTIAGAVLPTLINKAIGGGGGSSNPPPPPQLPAPSYGYGPPAPMRPTVVNPRPIPRAGMSGGLKGAAIGAAAGAGVEYVVDKFGRTVLRRRRSRSRGFSGRDIRQLHRLFKMLHKFNRMAPRHTSARRVSCR